MKQVWWYKRDNVPEPKNHDKRSQGHRQIDSSRSYSLTKAWSGVDTSYVAVGATRRRWQGEEDTR